MILFTAALGLACSGGTPAPVVDLADCAPDNADIDDQTLIAYEFESSTHEMVTCGSLTNQLASAVLESIGVLWGEPSSAPDAFTWDASSRVFNATGEGVSMDVTILDGGQGLLADPFQADSYLVGARSESAGGNIVLTFDEVGPLVSLLGQGASPSSPLTLSALDLLEITALFGSLKVNAMIHVDHEVETSTITYDIDTPAQFIADMMLNAPMQLAAISATGVRPDLSQSMETRIWDVIYDDDAQALDGEIEVQVLGGEFDFQVHYDFDPSYPAPAITITCLDA